MLLGCFGMLWDALERIEMPWDGVCGMEVGALMNWRGMGCFGMLWDTFRMFWNALGCFGMLWNAVGGVGVGVSMNWWGIGMHWDAFRML